MEPSPDAAKRLANLAADYWNARMANEPLYATALGDRRFDGHLPDISPAGRSRIKEQFKDVLARCRSLPEEGLSENERLTRTALLVDS
jgi:uncharacterized protein (DUF885 family)